MGKYRWLKPDIVERELTEIYPRLILLADYGKYRERVEILRTLDSMDWWDNYDEKMYNERMGAIVTVAAMIDDIPEDLQTPVDDAREVSDGYGQWWGPI
jgi:hypothetical protein